MATTSSGSSGSGSGSSNADQLNYFPVPNITVAGLARKGKVTVYVNNNEIVLVFTGPGQVAAIQARCPHRGGLLVEGDIEDLPGKPRCVIKCPEHQWKFNIINGECISPGPDPDKMVKVYPVRVNKDEIKVGFPKTPS